MDLVIKGGTIIDGTGAAAYTSDVRVEGDRIVEIGSISANGARVIDADGLLVTPGFVDLHTHFDGQATWDPLLMPSSQHGVTTVAMGNCGVGFAPAKPDRHNWLIALLEGVEDIPGTALAEGLTWGWESFPEYLDVLESQSRVLDVAAHVPHAPLRAYVMGERGADLEEHPSELESAQMAQVVEEALAAGAIGFATSRTEIHRSSTGENLGTLKARSPELSAIAAALAKSSRGVIQLISDAYQSTDDDFVQAELSLIEELARRSGRPLSFTVQQAYHSPDRWRDLFAAIAGWRSAGLDVMAQVAPRPIGVLLGLEATANPFLFCSSFDEVAREPLAVKVAKLSDPDRKAAILAEHVALMASLPEGLLRQISGGFEHTFEMADPVDYQVDSSWSLAAAAGAAGVEPASYTYDLLLQRGGTQLLYLPLFNFANGNLDDIHEMLSSPQALFGLSDAGAHCGAICDASSTTSFLTIWARDRKRDGLGLETVVNHLTQRTARHVGWDDRGEIAPGKLADLNLIDLENLGCAPPRIVYDLPAGGRRLVQDATGYVATLKSGRVTFDNGSHTGELPGTLVRG